MTNGHPPKIGIALLGLIITLGLAFGLDQGIAALTQNLQRGFLDLSSSYLAIALGNLLLAGCLIALAWYVNFRGARRRVVAWLFLIIGGLATFEPLAFWVIFLSRGAEAPQFLGHLFVYLTVGTRLNFSVAAVSIIGAIGLVQRRSK